MWHTRVPILATVAMAAALLTVSSAAPASSAGPIYVDIAAVGADDGSSWPDAYTDLQDALAVATAGDEIRVAEGTYRPHASDRAASFVLVDGVDIVGGYAVGGIAGPDSVAYPTILSGDLAANDLAGTNTAENSFHVIRADASIVSGVVVRGITVTAGNADGLIPDEYEGGGILVRGNANLTLDDVEVVRNEATFGGGMFNESSALDVQSSVFSFNTASDGGGVWNELASPTMSDSVVSDNMAADTVGGPGGGGGVLNFQSSPTITNTRVSDNTAVQNGGGIWNAFGSDATIVGSVITNNTSGADGAGIFNSAASPTVSDTAITANSAGGFGGGFSNDLAASDATFTNVTIVGNSAVFGGGIHSELNATYTLDSSAVVYNSASDGGGIFNDESSPNIVDTVVVLNAASGGAGGVGGGGGIVNVFSSSPWIVNSVVSNNSSYQHGGGLYNGFGSVPVFANTLVTNNQAAGSGGGIYNCSATVRMGTSVVADNSASTGGGIHAECTSSVEVSNSIIWPNTPAGDGVVLAGPSSASVQWSDVEGWGGGSNLDTDPLFVGPGNYRLQPSSPAREAGNSLFILNDIFDVDDDGNTTEPTPDLDGRNRISGIVDLGAYEIPLPALSAGVGVANPERDTGSQIITVPVTLSDQSAVPVTVDWATLDVPSQPSVAHPGSDYVAASGQLTFLPGETLKEIPVEVLGDTVIEPPIVFGEWGLIQLTNPDFATVDVSSGLWGLGIFVIVDDD